MAQQLQASVLLVASCCEKLSEQPEDVALTQLSSAVNGLRSCCCGMPAWSSSTEQATDAWGYACTLWVRTGVRACLQPPPIWHSELTSASFLQNAAIGVASRGLAKSSKAAAVQTAWLRHMACELLHAVPEGQLQEFQQLQMIKFCLKVCDPPPPLHARARLHALADEQLPCSNAHSPTTPRVHVVRQHADQKESSSRIDLPVCLQQQHPILD